MDWAATLTSRPATIPKWLDLTTLPTLKSKDGELLGDDVSRGLVARLKMEHERPDPIAWRAREYLCPAAAAEFGSALVEAWREAGEKPKEKWALFAQGFFADEVWIRSVAPTLDDLTSRGRHVAAGWYLTIFQRCGGSGLDWIGHWADYATTPALKVKAQAALMRLAADAGVDVDTFRDRLNPDVAAEQEEDDCPTFGFDTRGRLHFGRAALQLRDDGSLSIVGGDSSPELRAEQRRLQNRIRPLVKATRRRMERGMVSERSWTGARLRRLCAHPLLSLGVRGLVFIAGDGRTMRRCVDGWVDARDEDCDLADDAEYQVAHRLRLSPEELDSWGAHLAEFEVVQPFQQIDREVFGGAELCFEGERVIAAKVLRARLRRGGWRHVDVEGGMVHKERLRLGPGVFLCVEHSGYEVAHATREDIRVEALYLTPCPKGTPVDVDPVTWSEAQRTLMRLMAE